MTEFPLKAERLRIYTGEDDKHKGRPVHEVIVELARKDGLGGATTLRGILGFGKNSRVRTNKVLRLSEDLPLITEIVDTKDRIEAFLPKLDDIIEEGLVTREPVTVELYRHKKKK
ncbi:DUF190 domain-containing protein [Desulfobaculum bizertense]|uniref:Uncharacterized protein n=1 Tax=Desulfobaculum bizertense DSM 18034 TaxID=1121442 RepID=A0A1T4WY82_9BACT|nr:DUF190 domain-containing protein [Desulfobaculum bizertense]UIJ38584.1 DUF190 domain-containing protein [Desulfobaculum bizertense]SKA81571.1 hypothetical protein SAMN02745702_02726 [Desulfobaculum bizertense DSM 18034]